MKKYHLRSLIKVPFARFLFPKSCVCPICHKQSAFFLPSVNQGSEFLHELGAIGGNPHAFQCSWCGATDRERHLWMYIESSGILNRFEKARILHFAPEKRLVRKVLEQGPEEYIFADLYPSTKDVLKIDIQQTGYEADSFDVVIANHVLEHVESDTAALKEIFRILKPGGFAILQTPYCAGLNVTWSDPGVKSDKAREIAYGQADHVRLYGADIFNRFAESGLVDDTRNHIDELDDISPETVGVNGKEPFFLFRKPILK